MIAKTAIMQRNARYIWRTQPCLTRGRDMKSPAKAPQHTPSDIGILPHLRDATELYPRDDTVTALASANQMCLTGYDRRRGGYLNSQLPPPQPEAFTFACTSCRGFTRGDGPFEHFCLGAGCSYSRHSVDEVAPRNRQTLQRTQQNSTKASR